MQTSIEKQYLEMLKLLETDSDGNTEEMDYGQLDHCLKNVKRELQKLQHEADAISFKIHLARALRIHLSSRQRTLEEIGENEA